MKRIFVLLFFLKFFLTLNLHSQEDSLFVHFKDGSIKGYAIKELFKLTFDKTDKVESKIELNAKVLVYPTPTNNICRIRLESTIEEDIQIQIFDNFGKSLYQSIFSFSNQNNEIVWNCTSQDGMPIPNGNYFFTINSAKQNFFGKILIIR